MFGSSGRASMVLRAGHCWALLTAMVAAQAQPLPGQGIFTCTDAQGRKLTSDRLIPDCSDREQNVLNPSGTLKARVGPTLTAKERVDQENKDKAEQEALARLNEEKRRDRALLVRYPSKAVHDKEHAEAIDQIGLVRRAAVKRAEDLLRQRADIDTEMEFYKKDPSKAPASLRRQGDEVNQGLANQGRFIAEQDEQIRRVNTRFNDELTRLVLLWARQSSTTQAAARKTR